MSEMERLIFAAAYAIEFAWRIDADVRAPGVTIPQWEHDSAVLSIEEAHAAVSLYRQAKKETDP